MPNVHIGQGGQDPRRDGEINLFVSPEAEGRSWYDGGKRVIFVNGMANSGSDHATSARALSLLQGCPVIGVFNRSDGFWGDIGQCLTDKAVLVSAQSGSFQTWKLALDAAYLVARQARPGLTKIDFVGGLIADNPATHSLYNLLTSTPENRMRATRIFCHSQGNLVTSNALTAVALALGENAISGLHVNSFGSPCRYWPSGLRHEQRAFTFDPVTWLDLNAGLEFDKVGFVAGHGFLLYLAHDAEFTVNRFRFGGWGMTANMDEEGLADYCVQIGNNPPRIKGIFERLMDAHWSDSDDVAHYYVEKMRRRHDAVMRQLASADASLIRLLIRALDEGYTTDGEYAEMAYLNGLL